MPAAAEHSARGSPAPPRRSLREPHIGGVGEAQLNRPCCATPGVPVPPFVW